MLVEEAFLEMCIIHVEAFFWRSCEHVKAFSGEVVYM